MGRFKATAAAQQYFVSSPVTLGLGRIVLALLLLGDVLRRWTDLDVWYTNAGLMPNHTMLWAPQARFGFSIFYSVSQLHEARFFVVLIIGVYLALLVGWRTRLMQVLALLAHVSLDCRVHYLTNGGDVALSVLLLWTLFLPLGGWLSVDALRLAMRRSRLSLGADGVASLVVDPAYPDALAAPAPRFDWAAGALVAQLAVIYFFNFVHKDGSGWREGRVLLDVLNQNRIATAVAVWVRPYLTYEISLIGTRATQTTEALLPALLLLPVKSLGVRRLAVFIGMSLHTGFALFINLGVFSETMICFWFFLLPHEDVTRALRWLGGARKPVTLLFDATCGAHRVLAHALLCMQRRSVASASAFTLKSGATAWDGAAATQVASSFIGLRPFAGLLRSRAAQRVWDQRQALSQFLGLDAAASPPEFPALTPARQAAARWSLRLHHGLLAYVAMVFVVQTLAQNRAVPPALKPDPPFFVSYPVEYLHFFQGWGMFSESPREDWTVVVRATTVDGRLVDPLSERSSPRSPPGIHAITDRLDHDEFWCDYLSRIAGDHAYEPPLRDWVLAYPTRTGNPNDRLQSFDVVQLTQVEPVYGQTQGTNLRERVLIHYP